jgi:hypothetical protein
MRFCQIKNYISTKQPLFSLWLYSNEMIRLIDFMDNNNFDSALKEIKKTMKEYKQIEGVVDLSLIFDEA